MDSVVELLDGGTGEELFARGLPDDRKTWSARSVYDSNYHDLLKSVHKSFIEAGSSYITTNNYAINPGSGFTGETLTVLASTAGKLAYEARDEAYKSGLTKKSIKLCGSFPPLLESYRPDKILPHKEGVAVYADIAKSLNPYVDIFLCETLSSIEESLQAVEGISLVEKSKPIYISWTAFSSPKGCLRSGEPFPLAIETMIKVTKSDGSPKIGAFMLNCCEPELITSIYSNLFAEYPDLIKECKSRGIRFGAYGNRLTPHRSD